MDHAFGQPGSTGRVHNEHIVLIAPGDLGFVVCGVGQQGIQAVRSSQSLIAGLQVGFNIEGVLLAGLDSLGCLRKFGIEKQCLGAAVRENERQFAGGEPGVQGYHHQTQLGGAIEQGGELNTVIHQQGHALSLLQSCFCQHSGALVGEAVEVGPGSPYVSRRLYVRLEIG